MTNKIRAKRDRRTPPELFTGCPKASYGCDPEWMKALKLKRFKAKCGIA